MKCKNSKRIIGLFATAIIITAGIITINYLKHIVEENEKKVLRASYPACDSYNPLVSMSNYKFTLDDVVKKLGIIVVGEVFETSDNYAIDMAGEEGTPERAISDKLSKSGIEPLAEFVSIKFKVTNTIKGQVDADENGYY